jgi:RNA polymerase sigma-70 factor (ECF subfamily)
MGCWMQTKDEEAFRLVLAHRTMLKAFIKSHVRDPILAEDVFSDVILEIVKSRARFDQERTFGPWARGIARRVALASVRREHGQPRLLDATILEGIAAEIDALGGEGELDRRKEALRQCIQRLSEANQRLIRLRYFENQPYEAIARLVEKSVGAIYVIFSRLHHALAVCVERELRST